MKIKTIDFPSVMRDNDVRYLSFIEAILNSVDELCTTEAKLGPSFLSIRIAPSSSKYGKLILAAVKDAHYFLGLRVEFSKSMKASMTVEYKLFEDSGTIS